MAVQCERIARPREEVALRLPWPHICADTSDEDTIVEQCLNASRKSVYKAIDSTEAELVKEYGIQEAAITTAQDALRDRYRHDESLADLYEKPDFVAAYLRKYTPRYADAFLLTLLQLAHCGLIPSRPRILDLGAGCGTNCLALVAFLESVWLLRSHDNSLKHAHLVAHLTSIDRAGLSLEANNLLMRHASRNAPHVMVDHSTFALDLGDSAGLSALQENDQAFDLVVMSNVMCELSDETRSTVLRKVARLVTPEGTVVVIDPADSRPRFTAVRQACFAASSDGLNMYGPCFGDCTAQHGCWSYMRALTVASNQESDDACYALSILRRDGLVRFQRPSTGTKFRIGVPASLDLQVLVIADIREHDSYRVCDGSSKELWLKKSPGVSELKTGWMYTLVSESAVCTINKASRFPHYELDLGKTGKAEPCPCGRPAVWPGLRVEHETFGPGKLVGVREGCRGEAEFLADGAQATRTLQLGFCFDRLYLRRIGSVAEEGIDRDHQC